MQGFGQSSDMIKFAPKAQLTAIVDNWGALLHRAASRRCSTAPGNRQTTWEGMAEGWCASRPSPTCRTTSQDGGRDTREKIKTGKLHPFTGPITKQDGTRHRRAGKPLPDGEILGMNWYVKGVDDKLP